MFDAAQSDSAPDIFIMRVKIDAKNLIIQGIILRKYRAESSAEKKTMVGRDWNARINPCEPSTPGGIASEPKTKRVPAADASTTLITKSFNIRKNFVPAGILKINRAKKSWRTIPQITARQLKFLWLVEKSQAIAIRTKIPEKLIRLYIYDSREFLKTSRINYNIFEKGTKNRKDEEFGR